MNVRRIAIVSMLVLGSIVVSAVVQAQGESGAKTLTASEIKWAENPALPKGVKAVILMGDPTQGPYVNRVQLPGNVKIMPHSHPTENLVTVALVLGTLVLGERLAPRHFAGMGLIAGGLAVIDGRLLTGKGPVVFQVSVPGKSSFDYVDAKDDPRKK